ncbi:hypothetical protein HDU93_006500, partial [Gonapodya sp. JEL0774]
MSTRLASDKRNRAGTPIGGHLGPGAGYYRPSSAIGRQNEADVLMEIEDADISALVPEDADDLDLLDVMSVAG